MSTESKAAERNERKTRVGVVVSNKMTKTIVVRVMRLVRHPLYHRVIKRSTKFKVHDEKNTAKIGDWVKIMETRRLSKEKRWRLLSVVRKASTAPSLPEPASEQLAQELRAKE